MKYFLLSLFSKTSVKYLKTVIYFSLSLISTSLLANSPSQEINFKQLTTADGLSQSYVFSIVQDQQGFLWFATQDGLNRYDGFDFVHYRNDIDDPNSLADNFVRTLFIDANNTLWVGTDNGLSRYNAEQDSFTNYYHDDNDESSLRDNIIWDIFEGIDSNNQSELLISTETGIQKYISTKGTFKHLELKGAEGKLTEVKKIYQDKNKNYWFGTFGNGIYIANQKLDKSKNLSSNKPSERWPFTIAADALFDFKFIDNKYWLATDNGLFVVSTDYQILAHKTSENTESRLSSNYIRTISAYGNTESSQVILGTEAGLTIIDKSTFDAERVTSSPTNQTNLSEQWVMASYMTVSGDLWIGTYGEGLLKNKRSFGLLKQQLNSLEGDNKFITQIVEVNPNTLWFISDSGGIYQYDTSALEYSKIEMNIRVLKVLADPNSKNLYLLSKTQDVYKYNIVSSSISNISSLSEQLENYQDTFVLFGDDICFINQINKLTCFDINQKQYKQALPEGEEKITAISKQSEDVLLVTTESKNIYQYKKNADKFDFLFSLSAINRENFIPKSIDTSPEFYWLSSSSHGLLAISKDFSISHLYNENNQLNNNFIADVLIDIKGNAWLSTNKGISVVDSSTMAVKRFDADFGISQTEFVENSSLITNPGEAYFGSTDGYFQFNPEKLLATKQHITKPLISSISIANKEIPVSDLGGNSTYLEDINVAYKQFPLKLNFAAPNSALPHQTKYQYRLVGLEESWIETDIANRSATYTNLSPGVYTFEYQVFDTFNPSHSRHNQLKINILPPWWLSKGAYAVYFVFISLLILYFLQQIRHRQLYHSQIKQSEERLKLSLWGSGDEMWDWNIKTKKIFRSNIWGILEFPQDGTRNVGTDQTNIHPNDIKHVKDALNAHFDGDTEHYEITYRVKNKNEQWVWVLDRGKIVERDSAGKPSRMTGTLKDISHIKKAEERLKLFAKCIENISDAVVIYDRQFNTVDVNKAFVRITGKSKAAMVGKPINFTRYPDNFTHAIKTHLVTHGSWHGEIESLRNESEPYYTDLTLDVIKDGGGNISHFVGVFSDITLRKKSEAELRKLANSDTLTSLPNRSFFQANQLRLVQNKVPHALLVFDLDHFKKINDSMGHQVGDIILIEVAKRISHVATKRISVYRLGGDEFSIIIENTNDIHTITSLAKSILRIIAQPLKIKNQEIVLYSSIGIVLYPEDGASPQELLKNADTAMYHAKDKGGNQYQFFSDSMNKQAVQRLKVEQLIRAGLKDDLFSVFYQPKIEITSGKVAGMEALVRFETPTKGVISPLVFIPISEETGQIIDIGEIVLRKSCFAAKKWVDAGLFDGRVAVNLSAVQFTQPNLPKMIASILEESQLPPKHLELEITEGTVMDSPQQAIDTMLQIRSMGIHLSLDDFGTGYSSLAYLKKFPLNTLKIDKAFVDDIELSEQGRNMVATIVTIAHNLGMSVVAEGVENNNQLNFLSGLGCEQLQGYLYSKPLPENEFQKYLLSFQITDQSTSLLKS